MAVFGSYSHYYNLFYQDKDYAGEARFVHELIQRYHPGARGLLDLGCGTGRHDFLLAGNGYEVTGIDRSQDMLAVATEQAIKEEKEQRSSYRCPVFHQGDIRQIRLDCHYDVVVSLFHVISYQTGNDDLRSAFATAKAHLKPGGVFIFDCWYGPAVLTDRPVVRVKRLEDDEYAVTRIVEPVMQANTNVVDLHYEILVREKSSGKTQAIREIHHLRYLFRTEIEMLLQEAGMTLLADAEWMTNRPLGFDTWGACFVAHRTEGRG